MEVPLYLEFTVNEEMLTVCLMDIHINLRALLTPLHSERPKLYTILAFLSANC